MKHVVYNEWDDARGVVRKPHAVEENTNRRREGIEQKSKMKFDSLTL